MSGLTVFQSKIHVSSLFESVGQATLLSRKSYIIILFRLTERNLKRIYDFGEKK